MNEDAGYRLTRLSNGVRVVTAPMRERASATVALMVDVGSRHETESQSGLSHFIEHMVFKGGDRYPTARAVSETIEGVGGTIDAATDKEATVFWAKVPADHTEVAIDVICDMVLAPRLEQGELAKERLVVVEELRMSIDNPQDHVGTLFDEVMWPDHPLGREIAGSEATVMSFGQEDCQAHLDVHYRPANMVVSVAGAIEPERVLEAVAVRVEHLVGGGIRPAPLGVEAAGRPESPLRFLTKRCEQANLIVGLPALSYVDPERFTLDILNGVLGEGMSSRLFLELREQRALAYDVHSFTIRHRDSGALAMYIGCDPKHSAAALEAAIAELEKLAAVPLTASELARAQEYARGRLMVQLESTSARCNFLGQQELLTGEILAPGEVMSRIGSVDQQAVQSLSARLLEGEFRAAVVAPLRSPARLGSILSR